jgi:hypothetical protein
MIGAGMDGVLGEGPLGNVDLAAAANATPAADGIKIDAKRAGGFKQTCTFGELAAFSGRREDNAMGAQL